MSRNKIRMFTLNHRYYWYQWYVKFHLNELKQQSLAKHLRPYVLLLGNKMRHKNPVHAGKNIAAILLTNFCWCQHAVLLLLVDPLHFKARFLTYLNLNLSFHQTIFPNPLMATLSCTGNLKGDRHFFFSFFLIGLASLYYGYIPC
jgi:hypothetical protein